MSIQRSDARLRRLTAFDLEMTEEERLLLIRAGERLLRRQHHGQHGYADKQHGVELDLHYTGDDNPDGNRQVT